MKCKICKINRKQSDYYNSDNCYKCEYKRKSTQVIKQKRCKICAKAISSNRWAYCSSECLREGKNQWVNWTRNIKSEKCSWGDDFSNQKTKWRKDFSLENKQF